ncbi:MAG: hypothetical protein INQ03_17250 [Candidatus Heimdallarchaeota archaeon]|nr:hypothetical protein [Candidatus Heimdallarchaeota archaeon]
MSKKIKKLTGAEHAKLNKRKKFYERLERYCERNKDEEVIEIFLGMNKNYIFPDFDDLSLVLKEKFEKYDPEINIDDFKTIEIAYLEEAHFLQGCSQKGLITILQSETKFNSDGSKRKGANADDEDYNYQAAFFWGIRIDKFDKLIELLEKEKEEPSYYDLTPDMAEIQEPIHYKSKKPPRRRRRR